LKLEDQYIIPFKGLKDGEHEFEFSFDKLFFDKHEVLEVRDGRIKANVQLNKRPLLLTLSISIGGFLEVQCDRCLDYFDLPIDFESKLIVKFSENIADYSDEIWIIHPDESQINLEQYFFECIGLSMPLQRVHSKNKDGKSGCNTDMLTIIETHSTINKDSEDTDPRWNKLKDFLNDNNLN
jgi:uncharacterized protein